MGARVWVPKLVYQAPKWPGNVTDIVQLLPPFTSHSILPSAISFCSMLCSYCRHSLQTHNCHWLYNVAVYCMAIVTIPNTPSYYYQLNYFAVYCATIATTCYTLNTAIGYIFLQCIVQLLLSFATNPILPSALWCCSILYDYCCHLLHTKYCYQLYLFAVYCMAIATIQYTLSITLSIAISYIILQYLVQLLPPFATDLILPSAISFCSISCGYCRHSLQTQYCHWL